MDTSYQREDPPFTASIMSVAKFIQTYFLLFDYPTGKKIMQKHIWDDPMAAWQYFSKGYNPSTRDLTEQEQELIKRVISNAIETAKANFCLRFQDEIRKDLTHTSQAPPSTRPSVTTKYTI